VQGKPNVLQALVSTLLGRGGKRGVEVQKGSGAEKSKEESKV
jgi:hypothetical protein